MSIAGVECRFKIVFLVQADISGVAVGNRNRAGGDEGVVNCFGTKAQLVLTVEEIGQLGFKNIIGDY